MKPLFHPHDPKITAADRKRLAPLISNAKFALEWLRTNPSKQDIQRAILIEMDDPRGPLTRNVLHTLMRRLRNIENTELETRIVNYLKAKQ